MTKTLASTVLQLQHCKAKLLFLIEMTVRPSTVSSRKAESFFNPLGSCTSAQITI